MRQYKTRSAAPLTQVALYAVLLWAVLLLAYGGGRLYQSVNSAKAANESLRGTLAYLQSQVSANDTGGISVEAGAEGALLRLPLAGSDYETLIYCSNGNLMEELATVGAQPDPDKAQTIAEGTMFSAVWVNDHLLRLEADGHTALVSLRTEGAAQ